MLTSTYTVYIQHIYTYNINNHNILFFLDNEVSSSQMPARYQLKSEGKLTIPHVQSEDAGGFVCSVKNGVGNELQKKVTLSVIGEISMKHQI